MTTTPEPGARAPVPEDRDATDPTDAALATRRLHPWSWLFVLVQQLKQFLIPLVVLVFVGQRGNGPGEWVPLVGVGVLALAAVGRYFTYRYGIGEDRLVVRSGFFERKVRQVPFARIHNVAVHQSLLHRLFRVAEVRLESAGGGEAEAQMRVLRLDEALALEQLVRRRGKAAATVAGTAAGVDTPDAGSTRAHIAGSGADADDGTRVLLALPTPEVLRLGLISNRGMVVVAAAFALAWQVFPERAMSRWMGDAMRDTWTYATHVEGGWLLKAGLALAVLLAGLVLVRLLSLALALFAYHGFRLETDGRRLTVSRGLLSRLRTSTPRRRIQAFTLVEGVLHRLLGRRSLAVDTAAGHGGGGNEADGGVPSRALRELAPVATPDACDALVREVLRGADWPPAGDWRPLHRCAWWRLWWPAWLLVAAACAGVAWRWGAGWALLPLLWLPWSLLAAHRHAARAGIAVDAHLVAVREGWWSRHWRFAGVDKVQALELRRSWLDRRCGTATLWFDTAGANAMGPGLRCRLLPVDVAQALHDRVARDLSARPLRW